MPSPSAVIKRCASVDRDDAGQACGQAFQQLKGGHFREVVQNEVRGRGSAVHDNWQGIFQCGK